MSPKRMSRFFAPVLLLCAHFALASSQPPRCDERIVERVGQQYDFAFFKYPDLGMYASEENGGRIVSGVCKPSPDDPSKVIATFAYDGGNETQKDWLVALFDLNANQVLASYRGVIEEDAVIVVDEYSLQIDTGRYFLAKGKRAFGIRLNAFRSRCTFEGGYNDELTLFVVDGDRLRPVLSETMSQWKIGAGNACGGESVSQINVQKVIGVESTVHHGFADLRITAIPDDGGQSISGIVRYDGTRYDLNAWQSKYSEWWESLEVAQEPASALLNAVGSGDTARVIDLLDRGIDLNSFAHAYNTPVHAAAATGDLAMLRLLIERGADVNAPRQLGNRPLHDAAEAGNLNVAQWLLDHGAEIDALGYLDLTPLHLAARNSHQTMVEMLLQRGADANAHPELQFPPLHYAATGGDPDIMRVMLRHGASIDTRDRNGDTPLHRAAISGNRAAVELLVEQGAAIDARDKQLQTPLHLAVSAGATDVAAYLVDRGADPLLRDGRQISALERVRQLNRTELVGVIEARLGSNAEAAARNRDAKIDEFVNAAMRGKRADLERLLDGGVDINAINGYGRTALLQASMMDDLEMVSFLLTRGALPIPNHQGTTPLHIAAERGWGALVKLLLEANADPNMQDFAGRTPLHLALSGGYSRVIELLIRQPVDLHRLDSSGNSLLHIAAQNGNLDAVGTLLGHGADVNAQNHEGGSPLHNAVRSGAESVVTLLLQNGADVNSAHSMQSPLKLAVEYAISNPQGLGMVKLLLAHGADIRRANSPSDSLLQQVQSSGNQELIALLVKADAESQ